MTLLRAARAVASLLPERVDAWLRNRYWEWKSSFLYRRLFEAIGLRYALKSGLVLEVGSMGEWWAYNEVFVNAEYDEAIRLGLERRSKPDFFAVLDLGANVGYFSIRVIDLLRRLPPPGVKPRITMVEGSPTTFRELRSRFDKQGLLAEGVRAAHGLVGLRAGTGKIRESALHVKNSVFLEAGSEGASVDFLDLEELTRDMPRIDLLKCDVEGSELQLLENYGGFLRKINVAVLELHDTLCDTGRCVAIMEEAGFHRKVLFRHEDTSVQLFLREENPVPGGAGSASRALP